MTINDRIGKYLAPGRTWYTRNVNTITKFSIHHDAIPHDNRTADQVMEAIKQIHHGKNGWPGMSYHYYIHRDGSIYQVNKHEWVTWIDGINWDAIGIVMTGYFHPDVNNAPTDAQLRAFRELVDELSTKHPEFPASQKDVYAHRERAATACPGDRFYPYVREYREKLGKVTWGAPVAPTPPPPTTNWEQKYNEEHRAFEDYKGRFSQTIQDKAVSEALRVLNEKIDNAQK